MVTILPHTTRASGTLLTSTIYNADHQNHVTNATTINNDAGFKAVSNTWTLAQTFSAGIIVGVSDGVSRNISTGVLAMYGGVAGNGANIELYGGSHATQANNAFYDANAHEFRQQAGSGTPTVTIGGNTVLHTGNDDTLANAALLGGQNGAFYQNSSNQTSGTIADARLPTSMVGKTFTSPITLQNGLSSAQSLTVTDGTQSVIVGVGSLEMFRPLGSFIDFKDSGGDDFDIRLIHTGTNDLTMQTVGTNGSFIVEGTGGISTSVLSYTTSLTIGDGFAEDFRFNADAFLSNGLTVTKTAIGDTGTGMSLQKAGLFWISRDAAAPMIVNRDTSNGIAIQFGMNKTSVGNISVTGSATAFNTSSDERQKNDFLPIDPTLIDQIDVYDFAWNSDGIRAFGVKAQEIDLIIPRVVFKGDNPETDMWSVNYTQLIPMLIAKVQDLETRLAALEAA